MFIRANDFSILNAITRMRIRRCEYFFQFIRGVREMLIKDAIVKRLQDICGERRIRYNELATRSGVTPSTVYSMMCPERRDLSVITLKKLCDGLDMTVTDFFDDDIFRSLDQEMQ